MRECESEASKGVEEGRRPWIGSRTGQVEQARTDLKDARLYERLACLMSCDGVQCSRPKGKQAKSYPLSDFISFFRLPSSLSSLLSPLSQFLSPHHHHRFLRLILCTYRPLKSAWPAPPPPCRHIRAHLAATCPFTRVLSWPFSSLTLPSCDLSPTQPVIRSSIVPSTSTGNTPAFPLPRIALAGMPVYPPSPSFSIPQHGTIPSAASHTTSV